MKILLDTHILLWALAGDEKLPEKARRLILDEENEIYYSIAAPWEVEIKRIAHPDKMDLSAEEMAGYCSEAGYYCLPIREEHIFLLKDLARPESAQPHKDPFDRIMICQAVAENMLFVTHDSLLDDYGEPNIYKV